MAMEMRRTAIVLDFAVEEKKERMSVHVLLKMFGSIPGIHEEFKEKKEERLLRLFVGVGIDVPFLAIVLIY